MYAVDHLNMTVPVGALDGFIGANGSGKFAAEKLICGHLAPDWGEIRLFGRDYIDPGVRVQVDALIENAGRWRLSACRTRRNRSSRAAPWA
ncbi:MAG: ATP-binding cassette domain-containing protein [Aristaeellaceae bacterium]